MNFKEIDPLAEAEASREYPRLQGNVILRDIVTAVEAVMDKHGVPAKIFSIRFKTLMHIVRLSHHLGLEYDELEQLKGRSILDVACGKTSNPDPNFHPWFARIATHLGCTVTGVDRLNVGEEPPAEGWTYVNADLTEASSLYCIPENSFDVAHTTYFIGNPEPRDNDPDFIRSFRGDVHAYIAAQKDIFYHMHRVTKPSGIVIINDTGRKKQF